MDRIDYRKTLPALYAARSGPPAIVQVPAMAFLMIDGQGDPDTAPAYRQAVEALFSLAYALKFKVKKDAAGVDYGVMPLEGLWWADDLASFATQDRAAWKWTMMIMQPAVVTAALVEATRNELRRKKPRPALPALEALRFATFDEGRCAQVLHRGPFATEAATIRALHDFVAASGSRLRGRHHEIYLSDIRRAAPAGWKTILRQPVD